MKVIKNTATLILLSATACILCIPVFLLAEGSVMEQYELGMYLAPVVTDRLDGFAGFTLLPVFPTLKNYAQLLLDTPEFFHMFWNSMKIAALILGGQLIVSVPAAWAFAKFRFPGKNVLFLIYMILMLMPFQVTMLSNYLTLDRLGMIDTHGAVIWPAVFSAFPVFLQYRFFEEIPDAILEAAQIDGAGRLQIFINIGCPLGMPGIMSGVVLGFLEYWNLVEQPMIFLKEKMLWPLSLYLPQISFGDAGMAFAASAIGLLPSLFVFFAGQDFLEQGIVASAVKG